MTSNVITATGNRSTSNTVENTEHISYNMLTDEQEVIVYMRGERLFKRVTYGEKVVVVI